MVLSYDPTVPASDRDPTRFTFPRSMRLSKRKDFQRIFNARERKGIGPLLIYALPNGLGHNRLGLSVSRRVGRAVQRNRIKRLLREAFRLSQHELPTSYDLIIVGRPHAALTLGEYRDALRRGVESLDRRWKTSRTDNSKMKDSPEDEMRAADDRV